MPSTIPHDIGRAIQRLCREHSLDFRTLDWFPVYEKRDTLPDDVYEVLAAYCIANGEYRREVDNPAEHPEHPALPGRRVDDWRWHYVLDDGGGYAWKPGTGEYSQLRGALRLMGLIQEEGADG